VAMMLPNNRIPGIFQRIKYWVRHAFKWGAGAIRFPDLPVYREYIYLKLYLMLVPDHGKEKHYSTLKLMLLFLFAVLSSFLILDTYTPSKGGIKELKEMVSGGLLIAPLIGLLNAGYTSIYSLYIKVFDKNQGNDSADIEPRFARIKADLEFVRSLVYFGLHKEQKKEYIRFTEQTIEGSIECRKDIDYKNSVSTVIVGISILLGYLLLLANVVWLSLLMLVYLYSFLIMKQSGVFRTIFKQRRLEKMIKSIIDDYKNSTKTGTALFKDLAGRNE
jgi:hypothetical protein